MAHAGNAVVFVPYAVPGDTIEAEITESRKNFLRARILRVTEPSPVRVTPPCPYHYDPSRADALPCGGCSWQQMNYDFQIEAKRELVQETVERIGGISDLTVESVLGMQEPWRYRNKVQQPLGWDGQRIISGFFAPFSHEIVAIKDCLVQSALSVQLINRARQLLDQFRARVYDEDRHYGWIRHLWVRVTREDKAILVFVTTTPQFPHEDEIVSLLRNEFPGLVGVHQNINPGRTNVILGRKWRRIWGASNLEERLGELRFLLSPGSFFQVNNLQTEVLYNTVKQYAGSGDTLLDLYGGVGGIALWLAHRFRQVIGVDEVPGSISDAQKNADLNGIANARFVAASAESFLRNYRAHSKGVDLTVTLDPPRSGCDPLVLQALTHLKPRLLIYVSCDPATLARDLRILAQGGFRVRKIQPVDLFPQTPHIETVSQIEGPT